MLCVVTMIGMNAIEISGSFKSSGNKSGGNDSTSTARNGGKMNNDGTTPASDAFQASLKVDNDNICMGYNLIPMNHMCYKCKAVCVCACCCDEKGIAQQYMVQGVL